MRYRNLIIGTIIGTVFVALFGVFGVGIPIPTLAFVTLAFALFFAFFGGIVGAFVGVIDDSELTLVVEYRHYKPGDKVDVQVSLHPQKSFSLRGGKVELVYLETLYVSSDEGGLTQRTHERWRSALPFLNEQQIVEGRPYIGTFNFSIPNDALPSLQPVGVYRDPCAEISWRVQASLDIAGAQDIHQTRELYVYLPLVPDSSPPILGSRLIHCTKLVCTTEGRTINGILGYPDHLKFRSSMTLFAHATPDNQVFEDALQKYFEGQYDPLSLERMAA